MKKENILNSKKLSKKNIFLFFTICFTLFSVVLLFIGNERKQDILIRIYKINLTKESLVCILFFLFIVYCFYFLSKLYKKKRKIFKIFSIIGYVIAIFAFLVGGFISMIVLSTKGYHEFYSTNKKYTLVSCENSFLFLSDINLYQRKNIFFIEKIKDSTVTMDNASTPISENEYSINWKNNKVKLILFDYHNRLISIDVLFDKNSPKAEVYSFYTKKNNFKHYDKKEIKDRLSTNKDETEQNKLDNFSINDVKKLENSNFGLIQVDKAMTQVQWYFVKIDNGKMIFLSEIPDNSENIKANILPNGMIYLKAKDINGNIKVYKSVDGINWSKE